VPAKGPRTMLFAVIMHQHVPNAALIERRAKWTYPEGMNVVGEYWLEGSVASAIAFVEADTYAQILQLTSAWDDIVDVQVAPAISAADGMALAEAMREASHPS
jgi:hypothetical protein